MEFFGKKNTECRNTNILWQHFTLTWYNRVVIDFTEPQWISTDTNEA